MSKSGELRILQYGRSIDAPINYHHRTGDVDGSGGNVLDLYAQEESAEDVYFGNADEHAREMFVKGFKVYLKKVFTAQERQFLQGLLAGKESPYKIGRALGVEHFSFLQDIQRKAYKNAKPLFKLARLTGWSGAEAFTGTIYERLEQLNAGFALNDIIPQNRRVQKRREKALEYYARNCEKRRQYQAEYRAKNIDSIKLSEKQYRIRNRQKIKERKAKYYIRKKAEYTESDLERIRQYQAEWREKNREEKNRKAIEKYRANREEINKKRREQYSKNPRKITDKIKEYQAQYRAKKKAEREAKKLAELATVAECVELVAVEGESV